MDLFGDDSGSDFGEELFGDGWPIYDPDEYEEEVKNFPPPDEAATSEETLMQQLLGDERRKLEEDKLSMRSEWGVLIREQERLGVREQVKRLPTKDGSYVMNYNIFDLETGLLGRVRVALFCHIGSMLPRVKYPHIFHDNWTDLLYGLGRITPKAVMEHIDFNYILCHANTQFDIPLFKTSVSTEIARVEKMIRRCCVDMWRRALLTEYVRDYTYFMVRMTDGENLSHILRQTKLKDPGNDVCNYITGYL